MAHNIQRSLNARFTYRADRREKWSILRDAGAIEGDCEDYSLTLAWLLSGRSIRRFWWNMITLRFVIWHCKAPSGRGHVVMWMRGEGWTDNIQRRFVSRSQLTGYRLWFPYPAPLLALKMVLSRT